MGGWLYSVVTEKSLINVIIVLDNQLSFADSQTAMSKTETCRPERPQEFSKPRQRPEFSLCAETFEPHLTTFFTYNLPQLWLKSKPFYTTGLCWSMAEVQQKFSQMKVIIVIRYSYITKQKYRPASFTNFPSN